MNRFVFSRKNQLIFGFIFLTALSFLVILLSAPQTTEAQANPLAFSATQALNQAVEYTDFVYLPLVMSDNSTSGSLVPPGLGEPPAGTGEYTVIAWNDLGMHCMDPSFEDFSILPPYNTLWAQVVRRGEEPDIIASNDVTVEYRILGNTQSDNKTNFWDYAQQLFNLPEPLPANVGLKGFGLSGEMEAQTDHYAAEGIPLTEYLDSNTTTPYPYQVAEVVVKDNSGTILASTQTVAPVSTELHCEYCHDANGEGNPTINTGVVKQNILTLHDQNEGTTLMNERPVLCADCHASNALGLAGEAGVPNLSSAIHSKHAQIDDGTMEGTCYACHPGPQTQCLRDVMYSEGETCQSCHGNMSDVADPTRDPWFSEPRCESCHENHGENPNTLYRFSTGHEGIYCQACHGSQHAVYPTVNENDNIQSILLQGHSGTIDTCTVCHTNNPDPSEGPHHGDSGGGDD